MKLYARLVTPMLMALTHSIGVSAAADFDQEMSTVIRDYDTAMHATTNGDARAKSFESLAARADSLAKQHPTRGEPLVWKGLLQAEQSAAERSLSLAKQARKNLEAAVSIAPNAYAADAYSTLGALYANLPGFPLSFGDEKKARANYQKALTVNPTHVNANLNYAKLLLKDEDYTNAVKHAIAALGSPSRPGREKADQAARTSAANLIAEAKQKMR